MLLRSWRQSAGGDNADGGEDKGWGKVSRIAAADEDRMRGRVISIWNTSGLLYSTSPEPSQSTCKLHPPPQALTPPRFSSLITRSGARDVSDANTLSTPPHIVIQTSAASPCILPVQPATAPAAAAMALRLLSLVDTAQARACMPLTRCDHACRPSAQRMRACTETAAAASASRWLEKDERLRRARMRWEMIPAAAPSLASFH